MLDKLKIDAKIRKQIDYKILISMILIIAIGCLNIYLATKADYQTFYLKKQVIFGAVSLVIMYCLLIWDYTLLYGFVEIFYWGAVGLLIVNRFAGSTINGAQGWIELGPISIQPSEFAKIAMILMLAKKMQELDLKVNNVNNFFRLAFYALIPMGLIVIQPDMGMTMVSFFICLGIFFVAGLDLRVIGSGLLAIFVAVLLVWNSGIIQQYQKNRLVGFLNPEADELGINLQLTQSVIAIGSGGLLGTGIDRSEEGTSYSAEYVPEKHTDFIFAVIAEHWGTIGAIVLIILYGLLIYGMIDTSRKSKDIFGSIICIGFASYFLFALLQNIGMTIGIMPITGITLPLVSYGGSSLLTTVMSIGLVLNIGMRKKKLHF